jgi:hypothetical protein
MKKKFHQVVLSLVLGFLVFSQTGASYINLPARVDTVLTFKDLGSPEIVMRGPYGTGNVRFNVPAHWILQDGAQLQLTISSFVAGDQAKESPNDGFLGAMLDVYFNGELQQSLPLKSGTDINYNVPIRASDLQSPRKDGSLEISFFLNASIDCDYAFHQTTVLVSSNSALFMPYEEGPLKLDLRRLPWPMYQPELQMQVDATPGIVVVPVNASTDEMQAALVAMATFGRMTNGKFPLRLVVANQLTEELRGSSNLILVGNSSRMPILQQLELPIPVQDSRFSDSQVQSDDGLLQMTVSPWATAKSILVVSGNSDIGVVKAAQALSTGNLQTGLRSSYSVIASVMPISLNTASPSGSALANSADVSLSDLGYGPETVIGIGVNWFSYEFVIPVGQQPSEKPYIDIDFSSSALVDPARSGFIAYINGELIGSARFTDETSSVSTARVDIPSSLLKAGRNRFEVSANLIPRDVCSIGSFSGLWMSIFPESNLHMPLKPAAADNLVAEDLDLYPYPFVNDPSLATTMFVLPSKDSASWNIAGDIAYDIGKRATGAVLAFDVAYNDSTSETINKEYNLILIGTPQDFPLIYEMKDNLPAYYEDGSNIAVVKDQQVVYRISSDKDLGYLQLFSPPWDDKLAVLAVLGTSSKGVGYAEHALIDPEMRGRLKGNFATVDGDQTIVVNTRTGIGTGLLEPNLGSAVSIEQPTQQPILPDGAVDPASAQKAILPALIAVLVLMVIVIVIAIWLRRRDPENKI